MRHHRVSGKGISRTYRGGGVEESDGVKKPRKPYTRRVEVEDNGPLEDQPEDSEPKKRHFTAKPCCGSTGPRHKKECAGAADHGVKEPTFGLMVLKCLGCGFCFKFKGEKIDATCPECRGTRVYPSSNKPDNDTIYEADTTLQN